MGLEKVRDEILNNATSEADKIKNKADNDVNKISEDAIQSIQEYKERSLKEAKNIIESKKIREKATFSLELKKLNLDAKKDLIEKVFNEVNKRVIELNHDQRKDLIKKLQDKAKKEIDVKTVFCNEKDTKLIEGFEVEEENILGGIIAENQEGSVRVNYSFDSILQNLREKYMQEISKILFG